MIKFTLKGDFKNSLRFFDGTKTLSNDIRSIFNKYGPIGVEALQQSTPKDTGKTAYGWSYQVHRWGISWDNSSITTNGVPIAILLQYGHGTRGGGYVKGIDYINPAMRPIFDKISSDIWKEIQSL